MPATRRPGWFSEVTGAPVRLVAMVDACGWRLPGELDVFGQNAPFTDAAPILVTAVQSLEWLRDRAVRRVRHGPFPSESGVSGTDPWNEDTWESFTIGEAEPARCAPVAAVRHSAGRSGHG